MGSTQYGRARTGHKNLEFIISISKPGNSWNSSEGHGKSWKSNMVLENKRLKDEKCEKTTEESETGFKFSRNKDKHAFHV